MNFNAVKKKSHLDRIKIGNGIIRDFFYLHLIYIYALFLDEYTVFLEICHFHPSSLFLQSVISSICFYMMKLVSHLTQQRNLINIKYSVRAGN